MKIIVDAFGGDNAPLEIIKGAMLAVEEYGIDVILVGNKEKISECIEKIILSLKIRSLLMLNVKLQCAMMRNPC